MFRFLKKKRQEDVQKLEIDWHVIPDRYADLVSRLELDAKNNPDKYKHRLIGVAFLGYGFLFGILILLFSMILAMIATLVLQPSASTVILVKQLGIPLIILAYMVVTALWVKLDAPDYGVELNKKDAPELFSFLKKMQVRVKGPDIYKVFLTDELNASIVQYTPYGVFGGHKNFLFVGVRLMQSLTTEEMEAVIAHEYGHIVSGDGAFSNWIFRIRETWAKVANKIFLEERWGAFIFRRFFKWYVPYFNAYSFVSARNQEYNADLFAAEIISPNAMGQALIKIEIRSYEMYNIFFDQYLEPVEERAMPEYGLHESLLQFWENSRDEKLWQNILDESLSVEAGLQDTHPSLAQRLQSIGVAVVLPENVTQNNAAMFFMGSKLSVYLDKFSNEWWQEMQPYWNKTFEGAEESRAELMELDKEYKSGKNLDLYCYVTYAELMAWKYGDEMAMPIYEEVLDRYPDNGRANFDYGIILLKKGDNNEGLSYIEKAIHINEGNVIAAYEQITDYLLDMDMKYKADEFAERAHKRHEIEQLAEEERKELKLGDEFLFIPTYTQHVWDELVSLIKLEPLIIKAWLVKKKLQFLADESEIYVLAMLLDDELRNQIEKDGGDCNDYISERIDFIPFTIDFSINIGTKNNRPLLEKISKIDKALLYDRNSQT